MLPVYFHQFLQQLLAAAAGLWPYLAAAATVFTVLAFLPGQNCNGGARWWRNRGLMTDACYALAAPLLAPYMRLSALALVAALFSGFVPLSEVPDFINEGRGPLAHLPPLAQGLAYLLLSDFLLYWTHRCFHGRRLWPFHAVHHSATNVDWTTSYRFHPVNLLLGSFMVSALMVYLGIAPALLFALAPYDTAYSYFVHANLNWTLGPLKYVLASPVFHRWHHTAAEAGGEKNFAPTLAFLDVIFGTFYMPEGLLPEHYGVSEKNYPENFPAQLLHPFRAYLPWRWSRPAPQRSET